MNESRLRRILPQLVEQISQCMDERRGKIALHLCEAAVTKTGLADQRVSEAIDLIRQGDLGDEPPAHRLSELVQELDEAAWSLQEMGDAGEAEQADYLRAFYKARAAASVAFAMSQSGESALESPYESFHAFDDRAGFVRAVEVAIASESE